MEKEQKKEIKKFRRVMIGTPTIDGKIDIRYMNSLIGTIILCFQKDIEILPFQIAYDSLLMRARNDIFQNAFISKVDDLIMIDSDHGWNPQDILRLLNHSVDIVGVAARKKTDDYIDYNVKTEDGLLSIQKDELTEVIGIGLGCMRITKEVIVKIWDLSEVYTERNIEKRMIFNAKIKDKEIIGEDISFCDKCRELGYKIYLDPYITIDHVGIKNFFTSILEWGRLNKKIQFIN